jgi:hypothetical protein
VQPIQSSACDGKAAYLLVDCLRLLAALRACRDNAEWLAAVISSLLIALMRALPLGVEPSLCVLGDC